MEKAKTGAGRRPVNRSSASKVGARARRAQPPSWLKGVSELAQWRRLVPELQRLNLYNDSLRDTVGRYCQHFADWVRLTHEIKRDGATVWVTMTNGEDRMLRINPAVRVRDTVEKHLVDLEDRFGFSPLARYRLTAFQAAQPRADLFGHAVAAAKADEVPGAPPPPADDSPIGVLRPLH